MAPLEGCRSATAEHRANCNELDLTTQSALPIVNGAV
jgi:hypothetical protein